MSSRNSKSAGFARKVPHILLGIMIGFIFASLVAGEIFNAYEHFWWWDDMLHTASGVILGIVGFLAVYFLNARYHMTISPLFVAVFAFSFAITLGVVWEIIEFTADVIFQTNMQRWNLPLDATLIGREYQGVGLRDTMSDLIVAGIGSLVASVFAYFSFKHKKRSVLAAMRHTFPHIKKRRKTRR